MIIATAGHVDHGKTSLVRALTGIETDRLKEEKQRGLTIDLGFAYIDAETGGRLGFVDVPGHIRFINNMLAGVAAIDFALLVIAADDGVMPQTIEHLEVLQLLGIERGLVAVTKIDRVEADRVTSIIQDIHHLLGGTFLQEADIYPVSTIDGDGIEILKVALDIAADDCAERADSGLFRLCIDRRFSVHGAGIVVTGSVFAGKIHEGDSLTLMPQGVPVRVRSLRVQDRSSTKAKSGDRCALNLTGAKLQLEDIHRGNWLTQNPGHPSSRIDAELMVLTSMDKSVNHWTPVHLHTAANHVTARVALLDAKRINPGEKALVQLVLDEPLNVCTGDRFVIRDQAALHTLGGGVVVNPWSVKRGRARPDRLEELRLVSSSSARTSMENVLSNSRSGLDPDEFASQFNLTAQETGELIELMDVQKLFSGRVINQKFFHDLISSLLERIESWHDENPGKPGVPPGQITGWHRDIPVDLAEAATEQAILAGSLIKEGNLIRREGYGMQLSSAEKELFDAVRPLIDSTKPPVLHDLAKSIGKDPKSVEKSLNRVVKTGQLARPVKNRYFLPEMMDVLKSQLRDAADEKGQFTVQQYRDVAGTGRNLAIEILEYFDRTGVTRRAGDVRTILD